MRAQAHAPSESANERVSPRVLLIVLSRSAMAAAPARPFRVALAVDASPAARHAATWAAASGLLGGPGTELHLVSVVPTPPLPAPPGRPTLSPGPLMPPSLGSVAAQGMEDYMRRVDEQNQAHRSLLQETAQRLVQQARRDGRTACVAMRAACLLRVDVRAVGATGADAALHSLRASRPGRRRRRRLRSRRAARGVLPRAGTPHCCCALSRVHASHASRRIASSQGVDHLVLGTRGMGAFKRALYAMVGLGSVSDYVLHHAPCAVTVVPEPPPAASQ